MLSGAQAAPEGLGLAAHAFPQTRDFRAGGDTILG